jgi:CubicO group peptidase (beta-lactamase class C family)
MMTRRAFSGGMLAIACGSRSFGQEASLVSGTWSGVLDLGSVRLRLKLVLGEDRTATIFSIDQGGQPIPGQLGVPAADRVEIEFPSIQGRFAGRIVAAYRIDGTWRQRALEAPLRFEKGEAALAEPPPPQPLTNERLAALRSLAGSPGLAAISARGDKPPRLWVNGERSVGTGIAIGNDDLWHLGSITKSMTATLVARLVESGAVRWEDSVGELMKTAAPEIGDAYKAATFRHLLCHRSGLPKDIPLSSFPQFSREIADAREERKSFARIALAMPPAGPMGKTYEYSNNGYVVAGAMLEAKLGRSWEDLIRAEVFEPLGLATAGFGAPGHQGLTDQPVGHTVEAGGESRRAYPVGAGITDNPVVIGPAGRVHMSLQDFLRYLGAHRDQPALLKPETWSLLHTPPFGGDYAMGWIVRRNGALWHNGSNTLWYAEALVDKAGSVVAAAASNDGYLTKSQPEVAQALIEAASA